MMAAREGHGELVSFLLASGADPNLQTKAGLTALALPVPSAHRLPASIQLIGPAGGEDLLLATGALIESAAS